MIEEITESRSAAVSKPPVAISISTLFSLIVPVVAAAVISEPDATLVLTNAVTPVSSDFALIASTFAMADEALSIVDASSEPLFDGSIEKPLMLKSPFCKPFALP